ncbi:MAG TPA: carboxylating nicotinate-nucleotide diphosphorylase [Gemmataceae bacterium]|jgi:nicotinate-nucleotide pyrophosphorylase (carboxylating)
MTFSPAETTACCRLIELALDEDLGRRNPSWLGDVTSRVLIIPGVTVGKAAFVARQSGVLAGLPVVPLVLASLDPRLTFEPLLTDGTVLESGACIARASGPIAHLLTAERTILNFLQHLSGVATLTHRYVEAVVGLPVKILDTRKTTPGWRLLEKYAVRCGGGHNHRMGLYDGILIKDNHLAAMNLARSIPEAIRIAHSTPLPLEVEVDTLEQLDDALVGKPDIVLLDNMPPDDMREAVRRRNAIAPDVLLEASGGVTLDSVRSIAESGVDRISVGALTHSAPALDIALDYLS